MLFRLDNVCSNARNVLCSSVHIFCFWIWFLVLKSVQVWKEKRHVFVSYYFCKNELVFDNVLDFGFDGDEHYCSNCVNFIQAWCMLLNDKVTFRMQWPQDADVQINGKHLDIFLMLMMCYVAFSSIFMVICCIAGRCLCYLVEISWFVLCIILPVFWILSICVLLSCIHIFFMWLKFLYI